jgi:hypothetical protein
VGAAILLALFLGPLGMFYSTIVGALVMLFVSVVLGFRTAGVALLFTWPIGVFWAAIAAQLSKRRIA